MRHVYGHEQADLLGDGSEARGPGEGLERPFPHAVLSAEALPPGDGQEEFQTSAVRDSHRVQIVVPARAPALRDIGDGEAAIGIGGEHAELETVGTLEGVRLDDHRTDSRAELEMRSSCSRSSSAFLTLKKACSAEAMKDAMRSDATMGSRRMKASYSPSSPSATTFRVTVSVRVPSVRSARDRRSARWWWRAARCGRRRARRRGSGNWTG